MILALIYSQLKLSTWLIKIRFVVTKDTITRLLTVMLLWPLDFSYKEITEEEMCTMFDDKVSQVSLLAIFIHCVTVSFSVCTLISQGAWYRLWYTCGHSPVSVRYWTVYIIAWLVEYIKPVFKRTITGLARSGPKVQTVLHVFHQICLLGFGWFDLWLRKPRRLTFFHGNGVHR